MSPDKKTPNCLETNLRLDLASRNGCVVSHRVRLRTDAIEVNGLEGGRGTTHSGCARCLTPRRIERVLIAEKDDVGSRLHDAIDDPNNPRLNTLEQRAESMHVPRSTLLSPWMREFRGNAFYIVL